LVFRPIQLDGRNLTDGGMTENVPVGAARRAGASRVIMSVLRAEPEPNPDYDNPAQMLSKLLDFLVVGAPPPQPGDIVVTSDVRPYTTLDFGADALEILVNRGRESGRRALGDQPCLPHSRSTAAPRSLRLTGATVSGVAPSEQTVMLRAL